VQPACQIVKASPFVCPDLLWCQALHVHNMLFCLVCMRGRSISLEILTAHAADSALVVHGCRYCKMGLYSCCDVTNPAPETELLYGHRIGGMHGGLHMAASAATQQMNHNPPLQCP
jgi:threonine dehydrogenase-like Zn-dependent dehydrogenase